MGSYNPYGRDLLGFYPASPSGGPTTLGLSAAATWLAMGFVAPASVQLSKVRAFLSAVTGTLGSTDVSCDLFSDLPSTPNASIESRTSLTGALASNTWGEWTGFTSASTLVEGTQYWIVWKNLNGTPASNFPTFRYGGAASYMTPQLGGGNTYGLNKQHSTNSGVAWGTAVASASVLRLEFSNGDFFGVPISNVAVAVNTTGGIYAAREVGNVFTTFPYARLRVRGVAFYVRTKTGTPAGGLRGRLYSGASPSLVATTAAAPQASVVTGSWQPLFFTTIQTLEPSSVYRMVGGEETNADASTINYLPSEYTIDNDANSRGLLPFAGTMWKTYFDGSTWTDTNTLLVPMALILSDRQEFDVTGGGIVVPARVLGTEGVLMGA